MSKDHAPEQELMVLFKTTGPQRPPVTNYQQSLSRIIRDQKKTLQNTKEKIAQNPYRTYPPAKAINNKLKKVKIYMQQPPHYFNRTDPPRESRKY